MSSRDLVVAAAGASAPSDPNFNNVSLLLSGDGTNGAQNNTFLDSSTNNFTITRNGNTTQGTFSPYGNLWSNYFNGSTDYLTAGTTATNFLCTGSTSGLAATFDGWVFPTSWNGNSGENNNPIWAKGGTYISVGLYNGAVQFYWWNGSSGTTITSSSSIPLNTWSYIAVTVSGSTVSFYINGISAGSGTMGSGIATAGSGQNEYIGSTRDAGATYFAGYISNWRISNSVRSISSTPTSPLLTDANTSLLTCQSNRFIDNSSNNFTLTVAGNTSVQRFSPFNPTAPYDAATIGGSSLVKNATDYLLTPATSALEFGSNNFTIELWYYPTTTDRRAIYHGSWGVDWSVGIDYSPNGSNQCIGIWASSNGSSWNLINADGGGNGIGTIPLKQYAWNHIVFQRNGTTWSSYINGVLDKNITGLSGTIVNRSSYQKAIGAWWNTGAMGSPLGNMSDFRILNGTAYYSGASFTPPTAPLTAITNTSLLLNFTNAGIHDAALMNDLETVGNAQVSTSVKKYGTGSLAFDGNGDYLQIADNAALDLGGGQYTIEAWVYPTALNNYDCIIGKWGGTAEEWLLYYENGQFRLMQSGYNYAYKAWTATNQWIHIAAVYDGTNTQIYVNGQSGTSFAGNGISNSTQVVTIGGYNRAGTWQYFDGYIDDLRITKGYARYTANFTPPAQALPTN